MLRFDAHAFVRLNNALRSLGAIVGNGPSEPNRSRPGCGDGYPVGTEEARQKAAKGRSGGLLAPQGRLPPWVGGSERECMGIEPTGGVAHTARWF